MFLGLHSSNEAGESHVVEMKVLSPLLRVTDEFGDFENIHFEYEL